MHILKYILVNKKEITKYSKGETSENENTSESDQNYDIDDEDIYFEAITAIDTLGEFDWREDDAGRWRKKYPNNVIRGDNNETKFVETLNHILDVQTNSFNTSIENFKKLNDGCKINNMDDLIKLMYELYEAKFKYSLENENRFNLIFSLHDLIDISMGIYNNQSIFFDIETDSSTLSKSRVEEILDSYQDYAIVVFDVHI